MTKKVYSLKTMTRRTLKKKKNQISILKWKKPIKENKIVGTREEDSLRLTEIGRWVSTLHCALSE